jgi:CRISPR/Cas system type I-B associated protein Csh2 (Cas7 group RAMP superfamily)
MIESKLFTMDKQTREVKELRLINNFVYTPTKFDETSTVLDDETKTQYKKAAGEIKARADVTVKAIEAIEDQLSDIQDTLDNLVEDSRYGSDAYWHKQVVDLTKFYLQDMIAQRHRRGVPLTEEDVIKLVSVATNVATKSIEAIKEKVYAS